MATRGKILYIILFIVIIIFFFKQKFDPKFNLTNRRYRDCS